MDFVDVDLAHFELHGAVPLPRATSQGYIDNTDIRIWYATYGEGIPVLLLHGGLGHSGNWGYQVPVLIRSGYRVVVVDSRGHGRSTGSTPLSYELMASDVLAVMDALQLEKVFVVGWSDGACIALILAMNVPTRVVGVFFFGCNMDPSGTKEIDESNPVIQRCLRRHALDYKTLSTTPDQFEHFSEIMGRLMEKEPNYDAAVLSRISVQVSIVHSEHDEFITHDHAEYLARHIPGAEYILLKDVSHFAPLQKPHQFNKVLLDVLARVGS